jgi:6-phosphogluconate dehydrogenase (decarboxylating)
MMVPAAVVEQTVDDLSHRLERGDIIVDGGNSHYIDDIRRAKRLAAQGHSLRGCRRAAVCGDSSATSAR